MRSLVREDPTCHAEAEPECHSRRAWAADPALCNRRGPHSVKPERRLEKPPPAATRPTTAKRAAKTHHSQK